MVGGWALACVLHWTPIMPESQRHDLPTLLLKHVGPPKITLGTTYTPPPPPIEQDRFTLICFYHLLLIPLLFYLILSF